MSINEKRPEKNRLRIVNEIGLMIEKDCKLPELKVYEENGSVLFWATVVGGTVEFEAMQYLNPEEAMALSKALERCAIQALKNKS